MTMFHYGVPMHDMRQQWGRRLEEYIKISGMRQVGLDRRSEIRYRELGGWSREL